jgi:hypothetical protein
MIPPPKPWAASQRLKIGLAIGIGPNPQNFLSKELKNLNGE